MAPAGRRPTVCLLVTAVAGGRRCVIARRSPSRIRHISALRLSSRSSSCASCGLGPLAVVLGWPAATIWRVLRRHGISRRARAPRPPANRYEYRAPGEFADRCGSDHPRESSGAAVGRMRRCDHDTCHDHRHSGDVESPADDFNAIPKRDDRSSPVTWRETKHLRPVAPVRCWHAASPSGSTSTRLGRCEEMRARSRRLVAHLT